MQIICFQILLRRRAGANALLPRTDNPTPYLSDVLVDQTWRRKGIASRLVEESERICKEQFQRNEIYVRVKEENKAALELYGRLGYNVVPTPGDPLELKVLKKDLSYV
jgi:ribosomal protein S18 acetylase RimI-like enzyme